MNTRSAIIVSVSVALLLVSVALFLAAGKEGSDISGANTNENTEQINVGNLTVSSSSFKSFLIRSDDYDDGTNRLNPFGKHLYEMQASGEVKEIEFPENMLVLSAQYSPNNERVLLSLCQPEGVKLCAIYLYDLSTHELTNLTADDPSGDYIMPVWMTDSQIAYSHNVSGPSSSQLFVPFISNVEDISGATPLGEAASGSCTHMGANDAGSIVIACYNSDTTTATISVYNSSTELLETYLTYDIVLGVDITNDDKVFGLVASASGDSMAGIYDFAQQTYIENRATSMSFISSDTFAYTDSPLAKYFIAHDGGEEEIINSPGKIVLDVQ